MASRRATDQEAPADPAEALAGFAHFPHATQKTQVRWR
jgi:hypothetical protein